MNNVLWIDSHAPRNLDELVTDKNIKTKLRKIIKDSSMNNTIIIGPHGCGKTSAVKLMARELYKHNINSNILRLDSYDYRNSKSVYDYVSSFCRTSVRGVINFKLVIFDDIDDIDEKLQMQLVALLDKYKNVRFVFISNTTTNIIEAIQSRCLILRFNKPNIKMAITRLEDILKLRKIAYEHDSLQVIYNLADGDIRQAINILQLVCTRYNKVDIESIESLYDMPQQHVIKSLFQSFLEKDAHKSFMLLNSLIATGYSNTDIVTSIAFNLRLCDNSIPEQIKIIIFNTISKTAYILSTEMDSKLQLYSCIAEIHKIVESIEF